MKPINMLTILLLAGCSTPQLFPSQTDLDNSCHVIVSSAYKAEAERIRAVNIMAGINTTGAIGGIVAGIAAGPLWFVVGPAVILVNESVDPAGQRKKSRTVKTLVEAGNRKLCADEARDQP